MRTYEVRAKARGHILLDSEEYNKIRIKLVNYVVQINKVANSEGKGLDNLGIDILLTAEGVKRKVSDNRSKPVRHLAESITTSFLDVRKVLRQYEDNIEVVDPQLKNNPDLVEALYKFESSWEKGREYLLDIPRYSQLMFFSQMLEILCDKYPDIAEQIENRDPNIFVWVPSLLILKSFDNEDKGICQEFCPGVMNELCEAGILYKKIKEFKESIYNSIDDLYKAYNYFEKLVLFETAEDLVKYSSKQALDEFNKNLKTLSMQLQRIKPTEWNYLFDLAMNM